MPQLHEANGAQRTKAHLSDNQKKYTQRRSVNTLSGAEALPYQSNNNKTTTNTSSSISTNTNKNTSTTGTNAPTIAATKKRVIKKNGTHYVAPAIALLTVFCACWWSCAP